jgi:membrane associated rhomboid family serine protease
MTQNDNIIHFRQKEKGTPQHRPPPMFNLPIATKFLAGTLIFIQLALAGLTLTIFPDAENYAYAIGGFVPASWTGAAPFFWWTPISIILFSFLHGGWLHLGVNSLMLVSIGSGLEKAIGVKHYLFIYFAGTLFSALSHFAFAPFSTMPIIGASGGVSALFGAMLYMIKTNQATLNGNRGNSMLPVVFVWIGISIIGGYLGSPNGSPVAWIAHIGGFLSGIGLMMMLLRHRQ